MSNDVTVWKPRQFEGSDMLPLAKFQGDVSVVDQVDMRGRENIKQTDLIVPSLKILTGQSKPIMEGVEGAKVGLFHLSSVNLFLKPPLRVLLVAHMRSRALFPNEKNPNHSGLEVCLSRDGLTGNVYGNCMECSHKDWPERERGKKDIEGPACSESHNFIVLTEHGPALLRMWRKSFKAARQFLTNWNTSPHPIWKYPTIITAKQETKTLPGGKQQPYFVLDLRWDPSDTVPPAAQEVAWQVAQAVGKAYDDGRFGADDDDQPATGDE